MLLQQRGAFPTKEVLATGTISSVVSTGGSAVVTVLVEALHLATANIQHSTLRIVLTPAEMLSIAEAYDAGMDIDDDGEEAAHG